MAKYDWEPCPYCVEGQLHCKGRKYECNRCGKKVLGMHIKARIDKREREEGGPKSHLELKVFDPETD